SPGAKTATVALDAGDGALSIDLARAGGGLRDLSLAEDPEAETLASQQGDVTLAISRIRPGTIALAIDLASGCAIRGTLIRKASQVAACDRAVALARIEKACTKLTARPIGLVVKKWKAADAERCTASADAIETEVIDAGCLPVADPAGTLIGAQCRQMVNEAEALKRCVGVPPQYAQVADRLIALAQPAMAASKTVVASSCEEGHQMLVELAAYAHCPL
ncbi:MAG: hypothetical protein ABI175_18795, partial [Polyangiales bacterium]